METGIHTSTIIATLTDAAIQRCYLRAARDAWDASVRAQGVRVDMWDGGEEYAHTLCTLDDAWRLAALPCPWYPSMVANGYSESGHTAAATRCSVEG